MSRASRSTATDPARLRILALAPGILHRSYKAAWREYATDHPGGTHGRPRPGWLVRHNRHRSWRHSSAGAAAALRPAPADVRSVRRRGRARLVFLVALLALSARHARGASRSKCCAEKPVDERSIGGRAPSGDVASTSNVLKSRARRANHGQSAKGLPTSGRSDRNTLGDFRLGILPTERLASRGVAASMRLAASARSESPRSTRAGDERGRARHGFSGTSPSRSDRRRDRSRRQGTPRLPWPGWRAWAREHAAPGVSPWRTTRIVSAGQGRGTSVVVEVPAT
jgi:hypothetical protein